MRYDADDPYLVVAADKGTATFSDIANGIAARLRLLARRCVRLAVAAPATTTRRWASRPAARGRACAATRAALGKDVDRDELTVVGIGDMSGDVFGNGLLRSPHVKLVAAFDHRHIFIDPDPDPAASFAERQRLFELPRQQLGRLRPGAHLGRRRGVPAHR